MDEWLREALERLEKRAVSLAKKQTERAFDDRLRKPLIDELRAQGAGDAEIDELDAELGRLGERLGGLAGDTVATGLNGENVFGPLRSFPDRLRQPLEGPGSPPPRSRDTDFDWGYPVPTLDQDPRDIVKEGLDYSAIGFRWKPLKIREIYSDGGRLDVQFGMEGRGFLSEDGDFGERGRWEAEVDVRCVFPRGPLRPPLTFTGEVEFGRDEDGVYWAVTVGGGWRF